MQDQNQHQTSNSKSLEELVDDNYGLLVSQALLFNPRQQDLDDYIQVAAIGLIKAIKKFDPSRTVDGKKVKFSTYATVCIRNEIKNYLRDEGKHKLINMLPETDIPQEINMEVLEEYLPKNLTKLERKAITLRVMNYSYEEIALQTNQSRNTIRTCLHNAYRKIRKEKSSIM